MEGVYLLGFVVQKSNMVVGGCKPIIGTISNSTLDELSCLGVEMELGWSGDGVGS